MSLQKSVYAVFTVQFAKGEQAFFVKIRTKGHIAEDCLLSQS